MGTYTSNYSSYTTTIPYTSAVNDSSYTTTIPYTYTSNYSSYTTTIPYTKAKDSSDTIEEYTTFVPIEEYNCWSEVSNDGQVCRRRGSGFFRVGRFENPEDCMQECEEKELLCKYIQFVKRPHLRKGNCIAFRNSCDLKYPRKSKEVVIFHNACVTGAGIVDSDL